MKSLPFVTISMTFAAGLASACASSPPAAPQFVTKQSSIVTSHSGYEAPGFLNAKKFIPADLMNGKYHAVAPRAYNDGYANAYEIETTDYVFIVQGSQNAVTRIKEINATEKLREISTARTIGKTAVSKAGNLVNTPIRLFKAGYNRTKAVDSTRDALLLVPSGVGDALTEVGGGIYQLGKTGVGVAKDGIDVAKDNAEDGCEVRDCAREAGKTVKSGFDALTGTTGKARQLHQSVDTDPYSDNHLLQKQVERLAYSQSLTGAGFSAGLSMMAMPTVSTFATGVGYVNNAEYLAQYSDPDKRREEERTRLKSWGARTNAINGFYDNKAYTPTSRTRLMQGLEKIGNPADRVRLFKDASAAKSPYLAQRKVQAVRYLRLLEQDNGRVAFIPDTNFAGAVLPGGRLVLPFTADYLKWTPEVAAPLNRFSRAVQLNPAFSSGEVHVIGNASKMFKENCRVIGLKVKEIN